MLVFPFDKKFVNNIRKVNSGFRLRWIRFFWTRDWEIISGPGGPEDGKRTGW
jgi:hypothetical protein